MHTTKVSSECRKFVEGFKVQTSRLLLYLGSSSVFKALHLNNFKESKLPNSGTSGNVKAFHDIAEFKICPKIS
jgi:hypothetical protein